MTKAKSISIRRALMLSYMKYFFLYLFLSSSLVSNSQVTGSIAIGKNQAAPFRTLSETFDALKSQGIKGKLSLLLEDSLYLTDPLELVDIPGVNRMSIIEIRPAKGVKSVIELISGTDLLTFNLIGKVVIDGRYDPSDTSHNLSLIATNPITVNTIGDDSNLNRLSFTLSNCYLQSGTEKDGFAFYHDDTRANNGKLGYLNFDTISITNNKFGSFFSGVFSVTPNFICDHSIFSNCTSFGIRISPYSPRVKGNVIIKNNFFYNCENSIYIDGAHTNISIICNKIYGSINAQYGMRSTNTANLKIVNNLVTGNMSYGILNYVYDSAFVFYNTIKIKPLFTTSWSGTASAACVTTFIDQYRNEFFQNNIFEIDASAIKNVTKPFIICDITSPSSLNELGNCYYNDSLFSYFGFTVKEFDQFSSNPLSCPTYKSWIGATKQTNPKSLDKKNSFISETDLHLAAPNHQGLPIAGITVDLDGNPRDPIHPDAGAYEFVQIAATPVVAQVGQCQGSAIQFSVTGLPAGSWTVAWKFGDGQSGSGVQVQHVYAAGGSYTVSASISGAQSYALSKSIQVLFLPLKPTINISLPPAK